MQSKISSTITNLEYNFIILLQHQDINNDSALSIIKEIQKDVKEIIGAYSDMERTVRLLRSKE